MSTTQEETAPSEVDEALNTFSQPAAPGLTPLDYLNPKRWLTASGARAYPIIIALVVIWVIFDVWTHGTYLSAQNISNILVQMTEIGVLSIGIVVILLLGEIDLSVASTAALAGVASALVMQNWVPHAPDVAQALAGVGAALVVGLACGAFQGWWVAYLRVPSFVVTLAGLLAFQGIALAMTNATTVPVASDYFNALGASSATALNGGYLSNALGVGFALVVGIGYSLILLQNYRERRSQGLAAQSLGVIAAKVIGLFVLALAVVLTLNRDLGVPIPVFIMFVVLVLFAYILRRTRFGRHIYATGGNTEAARRAGIDVRSLRWAAFGISGLMAGFAGIIFMARLNSASAGSVGQDALLNSIAAAVIGGTSLFGGRGTIWSALLGALVLASVQNGMDLTLAGNTNTNYYEYIVKGAILLVAVWLDTYARSRSSAERSET